MAKQSMAGLMEELRIAKEAVKTLQANEELAKVGGKIAAAGRRAEVNYFRAYFKANATSESKAELEKVRKQAETDYEATI